jgi:hypothetical protein
MRGTLLSVMLFIGVAGCATAPPKIADWRPYQEREIQGATASQVETALQTVFAYSRPGKYNLRLMPGSAVAERQINHVILLSNVIGKETWAMQVRDVPDGAQVTVDAVVDVSMGTVLLLPHQERPLDPSIYDLFWDRLDFALGRRADWVSCEQYWNSIGNPGAAEMPLVGLCSYMGFDEVPPSSNKAPPT